ncbi:Major Facilitator Superfamily Vesicular Transporter [Abortiporus biennis]
MGTNGARPWGLGWRSSVWYVTLVVAIGITTDLLVYSIIIPVLPFRLEELGYKNPSALVGWLLFGYSGGLVISTPIIAVISERYGDRKYPLILGQIILAGSQIMLMEAPHFWVMVVARIIQGISSSVVWVVGLALLCDTVPEKSVGKQLGIAMTGLSVGLLVGPPAGGGLYKTFGFRGPFIFGVIITVVDLIGRLFIIEQKDVRKYQLDLSVREDKKGVAETHGNIGNIEGTGETAQITVSEVEKPAVVSREMSSVPPVADVPIPIESLNTPPPSYTEPVVVITPPVTNPPIRLIDVLLILLRSPRALVVMFNTLIYGIMFTAQEPALPLHLQDIWDQGSYQVGIIFIASVIPTIFSSGIAGWWCDTRGVEVITVMCLLLALPWLAVMMIERSLGLFVVSFALQNFFCAAVVAPLTAELAAVSRKHDGVGYAHVYAAFNMGYGIGAAMGPLIGGQVYARVAKGWMVICLTSIGLLIVCCILAICFTGEDPILARFRRRRDRLKQEGSGEANSQTDSVIVNAV